MCAFFLYVLCEKVMFMFVELILDKVFGNPAKQTEAMLALVQFTDEPAR